MFEWTLSAHTTKRMPRSPVSGSTRRILLSDTLLADYSDDEIEVVLAHELSHHVHHDLWRAMAVQIALLSPAFSSARRAPSCSPLRSALRGVDDPAGLALLMLVGGVWSFAACRSSTRCRAARSGAPIAMRWR